MGQPAKEKHQFEASPNPRDAGQCVMCGKPDSADIHAITISEVNAVLRYLRAGYPKRSLAYFALTRAINHLLSRNE